MYRFSAFQSMGLFVCTHCVDTHTFRSGAKPSIQVGANRPLPGEVRKDPNATGKRAQPHPKEPMPVNDSSSDDSADSEEENQGAANCSDSSSVNSETSDTSLTAWREMCGRAASSGD